METKLIEYQHQGKTFEAHVAMPRGDNQKFPLVFVFHAWGGRDAFACRKAQTLAELGYIGAALDMYGKGVLGANNDENSALMKPLIEDRVLLRERMLAGVTALEKQPFVDRSRLGAIGFCFGGLCALDLARSGADVKGVVSFHGLLNAPEESEKKPIQAKVLVLHGHDDPMVPPKQVANFTCEMTQLNVDWQLHIYGNTMHAFTNPDANDPKLGTLYQPEAEQRAFQEMELFLREVF
ncbi:MAG: dienelactone hydrolase family protein [Chlamydiota bacterium]